MLWWSVVLAGGGCALGRASGKAVGRCPYAFSAQLGAFFPGLLALVLGGGEGLACLLAGTAAAIGIYLTGHGSRLRACTAAVLGAGLGAWAGNWLLGAFT